MQVEKWNLPGTVLVVAVALALGRPTTSWAQIIIRGGVQLQAGGSNKSKTGGEPARNVFRKPDRKTLQLLTRARKLLDQARYGEAVVLLGELLKDREEDGPEDYFFQPDKNVPIHRSLKSEAQRLIGRMPRKGREIYQLQYGAQAQQMLAQAVAAGDMVRLAEVSRRFFHTRAGYQATFLLGLNHFDRARPLAGALTLQRLRQSTRSAGRFEPTLSLVTATCWLQAGVPEKARESLLALKRQYGGGAVRFAGKRVSLFGRAPEALSWLAGLIGPQLPARPAEADHWVMFRGNASRNASTIGSAPLLNVRWRVPASESDNASVEGELRRLRQEAVERGIAILPGLHPLAVDDVVLMRTMRNLLAVNFVTGKRLWEVPVDGRLQAATNKPGSDPLLRFRRLSQLTSELGSRMCYDATYGTISSDGQYVFSVEDLGLTISGSAVQRIMINGRSQVVPRKAYNRLAAHEISTGKLKWHVGGPADQYALPLAETFFLGPPLPLMGRLYVLAEIQEEIRLLALDARNGDLLWSQQLAIVERNVLSEPWRRLAGVSPSYADGILVCPTSTGAVVAIDLATRSLLWGYLYDRQQASLSSPRVNLLALQMGRVVRQNSSLPTQRWSDSSVCVVDGCVLVTPVESDWLHCLNLADGELLWKCPRQDDLYVACVHQGKVVLVGRRGVRAVSLSEVTETTEEAPGAEALRRNLEQLTQVYDRMKQSNAVQSELIKRQIDELKKELDLRGNGVKVRRPKPAWGGRAVALPEGSMPSGRGFLAGDRYFVPLTTAEVVGIDLFTGKIVHVSKSRKGMVPGNLVYHKGRVISQGIDGVEVFLQADFANVLSTALRGESIEGLEMPYRPNLIRDEAARLEKALKEQNRPPEAMAFCLQGELLLDEGKQSEAIGCLRRAYKLDANPRTRMLLRDALLEGLRTDFAAYRGQTKEIEQLLDGPEQRASYLRLIANGLADTGDWRAALDHYLKLIEPGQDHRAMDQVSQALSVRRDRWVQAQVAALRLEAKDEATPIDQPIEARLQAAVEAAGTQALRRFLNCFGNHPTAGKARRELVRRLKDSGELLEAELILWPEQRSPDRAAAAAATAELAELLGRSKSPEDAAWCYRRLGREFADVVCLNGKTGGELLDALPDGGDVAEVLRRDHEWPVGKVEVRSVRRSTPSTSIRFAVPCRGTPGPFFSEMALGLDQNRRALLSRDALGSQPWQASLVEPGSPYNIRSNPSLHVRVCGHLLLLSTGYEIMALDTLGRPDSGAPKLLWRRDLTDLGLAAANQGVLHIHGGNVVFQVQGGNVVRWVQPFPVTAQNRNTLNALGPVTNRYVCFQPSRKLVAADPLTGKTLWIRNDVMPGSTVFGDDQFVFALPPGRDEAMVFRALDGKLLGKRKVPRHQPSTRNAALQIRRQLLMAGGAAAMNTLATTGFATIGRQALLWHPSGSHYLLELFDPWEQRQVWPSRKFAIGAEVCMVGQEAVGVFEPDGHFVLLGLPGGRTIVDTQLKPEERLIQILVFRSGDQYVVITNGAARKPRPNMRVQPFPFTFPQMIGHGWVYSFDLKGNSLWPEPVEIENQQLAMNQPGRLPVLTFFYQTYERTAKTVITQQVSVECIDKRTGRKIDLGKFPRMTGVLELVGDPEKNTVELRLTQYTVTMTFTDKPIPPPSEEGDGGRKLTNVTDALLKAFEKAAAETAGKSPLSAQDKKKPVVLPEPPAIPLPVIEPPAPDPAPDPAPEK